MRKALAESGAIGLILSFAAIVLPLLAIYAPLATVAMLIIVAGAMLIFAGRRFFAQLGALRLLIVLIAALGIYGGISASWSIVPGHSLIEAGRFLGIGILGLIVLAGALSASPAERRLIGRSLVVGLAISLAVMAFEYYERTPIMQLFHPISPPSMVWDDEYVFYRFDRGVVVMVLLLWAALFADLSKWIRAILLVAAAFMTRKMISEAALLALAASFVIFIPARFLPKATAALIIVGLTAISITVPLATPSYDRVAQIHAELPSLKWSGIHRLLIWRFASDRVAERPILGWGMDASRAMPGGNTDLTTLLPPDHYPAQALALPLHPHNGTLQLLLELGIPGLLLGLAIVAWIVVQIAWRAPLSPARRAGALALAAAAITIGLLSYGIWQEWWQATLWIAAALFAVTGEAEERAASVA